MSDLRDPSQRDVEINRPVLEDPVTGAEITRPFREERSSPGALPALLIALLLVVAGIFFLRTDAQPPDLTGQPSSKTAPNNP